MRRVWLAAAAIAAAGISLPAKAQTVSANKPETIVAALQAAGFAAKLQKDATGDPMIESAVSGTRFRVMFYGCKANKGCATIQFTSGYDKKSVTSLSSINDWNREKRFGRAFSMPRATRSWRWTSISTTAACPGPVHRQSGILGRGEGRLREAYRLGQE
jgi:hypothetical protein